MLIRLSIEGRPMRVTLALIATALTAAPAQAEQSPAPSTPAPAPAIPPELTDPKTLDHVTSTIGALSKAFMNIPVGEVEAAIEQRPVRPEDRTKTVRDLAGPDAERELQQDVAQNREAMKAGMTAMARSLPALTKAMEGLEEELARAAANIPRPDYPRR